MGGGKPRPYDSRSWLVGAGLAPALNNFVMRKLIKPLKEPLFF
jgi:hypothetical protein